MIRVVSDARELALAFSHPTYEVEHIEDVTLVENGRVTMGKQPVTRTSRKTVCTVYDVLPLGGEFVKRAEAEVRVHWTDNFNRDLGRRLAMKKVLNPQSTLFTAAERRDIWNAYWDRAEGQHISPPKPQPVMGSLIDFPQTSESTMRADSHRVVSKWIL